MTSQSPDPGTHDAIGQIWQQSRSSLVCKLRVCSEGLELYCCSGPSWWWFMWISILVHVQVSVTLWLHHHICSCLKLLGRKKWMLNWVTLTCCCWSGRSGGSVRILYHVVHAGYLMTVNCWANCWSSCEAKTKIIQHLEQLWNLQESNSQVKAVKRLSHIWEI